MRGFRPTYHFKEIDDFLAALRITTGIDTGYAQTIFRPIGWAKGFTADLEYLLFGPTLRRFPSIFENHFWDLEASPVSEGDLRETSELYEKVSQTSDARMSIATNRLNSCYLRDEEVDSILDSMIALETLLLQDDKEGITYKLAMRLTALLIIKALRLQVSYRSWKCQSCE